MKCVMEFIKEYKREEDLYDGGTSKWKNKYTKKIWELVGNNWIIAKFRGNHNIEMSWKLLYNNMEKG